MVMLAGILAKLWLLKFGTWLYLVSQGSLTANRERSLIRWTLQLEEMCCPLLQQQTCVRFPGEV